MYVSEINPKKNLLQFLMGQINNIEWTTYGMRNPKNSNQMSYEAIDVGSWSFVGYNVPMMNESTNDMIYEMNHKSNCGYEIKCSYDLRSYGRNFCNCVEKPENFRTSTGFEPVTSRYRCDALTN